MLKYLLLPLLCLGAMAFVLACSQPKSDAPPKVAAAQSRPQILLNDDEASPAFGTLEVRPLPPEILDSMRKLELAQRKWQSLFPVYTGDRYPDESAHQPAMLGDYEINAHGLRFHPRFGFEPGMTYFARLNLRRLSELIGNREVAWPVAAVDAAFTIPISEVKRAPTTYVENVYPTSETLPENLLKFYIYFSAPMSVSRIHEHLTLLNQRGEAVPLPFVEVEEGLWDSERKRLTLIFHPGRIKRGVGPNLNMGTPLRRGETYRLRIDEAWRDAQGRPLKQSYEKSFTVKAADRTLPNLETWRLIPPVFGSRHPLILNFDEPLDHGLLQRFLLVQDSHGDEIAGAIRTSQAENQWRFQPAQNWKPGDYTVVVNRKLEDLAGNNLSSVFDRDLQTPRASVDNGVLQIPFRVGERQNREKQQSGKQTAAKARRLKKSNGHSGSAFSAEPVWSPDGSRIAFMGGTWPSVDIYIMNADGSNQTRLTHHEASDYFPAWSPDGKRIAFASTRDGKHCIYVMDSDGSNLFRLTPQEDQQPNWSPDGERIVFASERDGWHDEIYVMNADGSQVTRLTEVANSQELGRRQAVYARRPFWSPDGQRISFGSNRDGNDEIYVMNADGSNVVRLTHTSATEYYSSWSPDGSKIAFNSNREGSYQIYIMNADGSNPVRLTGP